MPNDRIAVLDGWRGIAILLVLASHLLSATAKPGPWTDALGQHGVTLFFVISGYIITQRLLREQQASGTISLRAFYGRRAFRILPCAWAFLAFFCIVAVATSHGVPPGLTSVLLFFRNFTNPAGQEKYTGHFWSLSIEEQFYLVWPVLLVWLGGRRARWVAAGAAIGIAAWRFHERALLAHLPLQASFATQFRADALFLGCLAALIADQVRPYLRPWMCLPAAAVVVISMIPAHLTIPFYESAAMAALILTSASLADRPVIRILLGANPLVLIGVVSYSLYIWQQLFIFEWLPMLGVPWTIGLLFVTAFASYYCMERPLIRLGRRCFAAAATPRPGPVSEECLLPLETTPALSE